MTKYFYILSIIALAFLFACSEVKEDITVPSAVTIHGEGVLTPESENFHGRLDDSGMELCRECHGGNFAGGSAQKSCIECHSDIALHMEGILKPESDNFHGKYFAAKKKDMDACSMCHGTNFGGGISSPGCDECHSTISVHKAGIVDPASDAFHPKYMKAKNADMEACASCHGADYLGGVSAPTCAECHTGIAVHQPGILDGTSPNFHGKYIADKEIDLSTCSTCHGADFKGGILATDCKTCHSTIDVHTTMTLETHGQYFADQNLDINSCSSCHGVNFEGGESAPGCAECHSTINVHKEGILEPSSANFHGKYMADNNVELESCASCHGADFSGGVAAPGCTTCHETIDIHKDGITDGASPNFHGTYMANNNAELSSCATCHGDDFSGGMVASGCVTCHSSINVHQEGYLNKESQNFHGNFLAANELELNSCNTCHGSDFSGGAAAPTCKTCHSTIDIHMEGILDGNSDNFHGKYIATNDVELASCSSCHGADFSGGASSPSCVTCHESINVHKEGYLDKESDAFHGKYLGANELDLTSCSSCHGTDFAGGAAAPTCVTCHSTINVHKDGILDENSDNFHGKFIATNNVKLESCGSCHGAEFTGGDSSPTCATCHNSIGVHQEGIKNPASDNFHGKFMLSNNLELESCSSCHGEDFAGGAAAPTCVTCHNTIGVHKDGLLNQGSDNFHGKFINDNSVKLTACGTCHGDTFEGGLIATTCVSCHNTIGVHTPDIMNSSSNDFHGYYFGVNNKPLSSCTSCHGAEFEGGVSAPNCVDCHGAINVHKPGIKDPNSSEFHGKFMADNNFELASCSSCHGEDFNGGMSSPNCVDCHSGIDVHKNGIVDPFSQAFHGTYLIGQNWELDNCSTCHSESYSGGLVATSCNTCHTNDQGPEACNTCHGDFNNIDRIAPPNDLYGESSTSETGVGAHAIHAYDTQIAGPFECVDCHTEVTGVAEHIGNLPADIAFSELADKNANAEYNFSTATCSNTYCHGNFVFTKAEAYSSYRFAYEADQMTGNNYSVVWNQVDGTQAVCGTCHGELDAQGNLVRAEPDGHIPVENGLQGCATCHHTVVDGSGNIINKEKHINGLPNAFGN